MSPKHEVRRRLRRPGAGISIRGDASARLTDHQVRAIAALADGFVAGGGIEQNRRPGQRLHGTRWDRHPEVFANLDSDHNVTAGLEEQVLPEWNSRPVENGFRRFATHRRSKPPALVELLVVGQELLRNKPEKGAVRDGERAIVQAVADRHGQADHDKLYTLARSLGDAPRCRFRGTQERCLAEKIAAGVAGETQLGKHDEVAVGELTKLANRFRGIG